MTKACVQSILAQDIGDVWLYTIDNASGDGTGQWLRSFPLRTTVISHLQPVSLHRVWNEALTLAFDSLRLDYALIVNNDVTLRTDTYRLLVQDGGPFVTGVPVNDFAQVEHANPSSKSPHPSFSCFLIRREVWKRVGRFDESMWAWAGDLDYHLRMHALGIDAIAIDVPFLHEGSATIRHAPREEHERLCKLADADRATFERKWGCKVGSDEYYAHFIATRKQSYAAEHANG